MTDETEPIATTGRTATFGGRTPDKLKSVRVGVVLGTGLLLVLAVAVAMGASPSPSASGGGRTQSIPGFDGGGPFDQAFGNPDGFDEPGGLDRPDGHADRKGGQGHGPISVTAISGSNISLATEDGWTRTIAITSATRITRAGAAATVADIAVGDNVYFRQTRNSDGTYTITAVAVVLPRTAGTVTAVGTDTITITARDGTSRTIATTAATTYHVGEAAGSRTDVKVGSMIVAHGERAADGTLTATTVTVRLPHAIGRVTAVTAATITIERRNGTSLTIHVGSGTTIRVAGVDHPTLADIKTGMVVAVAGTERADGSFDATQIRAGDLGKGHGPKGFWPGSKPHASTAPGGSGG